jgi:Skp family chaperone for outer membrane proteins
MISRRFVSAAIFLLAWGLSASAMAQPVAAGAEANGQQAAAKAAERKAEHDRIRSEREAIKARRQQDESACYQRFSVEDCVRAGVRDAEARLRAQEIELNDAERKEKAAERLKSIEEKQRGVPDSPSAGSGAASAVVRKPSQDPQGLKSQRDHEAELRAQQQRIKVQKQAQEQAARTSGNAERAAEARARHAQTLQAAQERRDRVEKSRAEAAAQGRVPAAPLPAGSAAR